MQRGVRQVEERLRGELAHELRGCAARSVQRAFGEHEAERDERIEQQQSTDERHADAHQPVAHEAGVATPEMQQGREEPRQHEEDRHPEEMDEAHRHVRNGTRVRVLVGPRAAEIDDGVRHGRVQHQAEQHHRGAQPVERVNAILGNAHVEVRCSVSM